MAKKKVVRVNGRRINKYVLPAVLTAVFILLILIAVISVNFVRQDNVYLSSTDQCGADKIFACPVGYTEVTSSSLENVINYYPVCDGKEYTLGIPFRADGRKVCKNIISEEVIASSTTIGSGFCTSSTPVSLTSAYEVVEGSCVSSFPPNFPQNNHLVAYYNFNDGTANDLSGNNYNGVFRDGQNVKAQDKTTFSRFENGAYFDGVNDFVRVNDLEFRDVNDKGEGNDFSFLLWAKPYFDSKYKISCTSNTDCFAGNLCDTSTNSCALSCTSNTDCPEGFCDTSTSTCASYNRGLILWVENSGDFSQSYFALSQNTKEGITSFLLDSNNWNSWAYNQVNFTSKENQISDVGTDWFHIVGVFDSAAERISLYINGVKTAEKKINNEGPLGKGTLFIGRVYDDYYKGVIDDVVIYNQILTESQILTVYNNALCVSGNEKCEGTTSLLCSSGIWQSQGQVNGKCGYTSTASDNGGDGEDDDDGSPSTTPCINNWKCSKWSNPEENCGIRTCLLTMSVQYLAEDISICEKPAESKTCGSLSYCGDNNCDGNENSNNCLRDCPAECGNGIVESDEECDNGLNSNSNTEKDACRTNCKSAYCGDNVCDSGENYKTCPAECKKKSYLWIWVLSLFVLIILVIITTLLIRFNKKNTKLGK